MGGRTETETAAAARMVTTTLLSGGGGAARNSSSPKEGRKRPTTESSARPSVTRMGGQRRQLQLFLPRTAEREREREIRNSNSVPPVVVVGQLPDTALQGDWTGCEMERN